MAKRLTRSRMDPLVNRLEDGNQTYCLVAPEPLDVNQFGENESGRSISNMNSSNPVDTALQISQPKYWIRRISMMLGGRGGGRSAEAKFSTPT
jgi:hypothetical protein